MSRLHPTKVYPVIHVSDRRIDPVTQVDIALRHGAAGCFLIDHDCDDERLIGFIEAVRESYPSAFLGANLMQRGPLRSLEILTDHFAGPPPLDALWTDSAGVGLNGPEPEFEQFCLLRDSMHWRGSLFGGIAFKYQAPVPDHDLPALGQVARRVDIPTTSGPGTGKAADLNKLRLLRQGLQSHPLALASGVTPANVGAVAKLVDHILVSTGVSAREGGIDQELLTQLLANAQRA